MARFTLTIELPDDYDIGVAESDPDQFARDVVDGWYPEAQLVDRAATLLPSGHRVDADWQKGTDGRQRRFRLDEIPAPFVLAAVDCIDMSDHYPMPRKRAWLLEVGDDGRPL